jgi:hypothetical protein
VRLTEEGLGSHALRHAFGAILKKKNVREELRADLLGHRGKTETSERYCEATEIAAMYKLVCKMPIVTRHLVAHPINLPNARTGVDVRLDAQRRKLAKISHFDIS